MGAESGLLLHSSVVFITRFSWGLIKSLIFFLKPLTALKVSYFMGLGSDSGQACGLPNPPLPQVFPDMFLDQGQSGCRAWPAGVGLRSNKALPLHPVEGELGAFSESQSHSPARATSAGLHRVVFVLNTEEQKQEGFVGVPSTGPLSRLHLNHLWILLPYPVACM